MVLSKKELGSLIKKARNLKSEKINKLYTQKMLASDLNKSQSYIGDVESGRTYPSFRLLSQIADACGVPISFFQDSEQLNKDIEVFIKSQLGKAEGKDVSKIADYIKNDPETDIDYIQNCLTDNSDTVSETQSTYQCNKLETAEGVVQSLLHHPAIKDFCELDIDKLNLNETSEFINDFLNQLKLISYKYKK
ncbi:helix-turn-helix transcriptional regulator [Clostridiaceae bacterium UIB06]|uniref:Helix-turn-helix transcriptional regulator n=1 Tax=Clostridium thailandense TaxID=2794346 RepID=A0A949TLQ8_9CLOT|nr:helix-turn-helix transcriptional regulator [Clostridium thailandense]MBV7271617.1 helix-turn-helix transcriptional regulator [Clostridium thailandense]MCH5136413.1 helix-turn-helix transcriptional regulator [Clostridiaceae bacterium UIB06]